MDSKIRVELCHDHFQRLCNKDVCSTCPSIAENEKVVKAMSHALETTEEAQQEAIISELHSIRTSQTEVFKRVKTLKELQEANSKETADIKGAIMGNPAIGHTGIVDHLKEHDVELDGLEKIKVKLAVILTLGGSGVGGVVSYLGSILSK